MKKLEISTFTGVAVAVFMIYGSGSLSPSAFADPQGGQLPPGDTLEQLLMVTNDRNKDTSDLNIALNADGQADGIDFAVTKNAAANPPAAPTHHFFTLQDIASAQGAVLDAEDGRNAIVLKGQIDASAVTNTLTLSYLNNGLTGNYDNCEVVIQRTGNDQWELLNASTSQPVTQIFVKTWALGISTLEGICN